MLGIAGLWEEFEDIDGIVSHSFIMLTVPSSTVLNEIESEMPAILDETDCLKWLYASGPMEYQKIIESINTKHPQLASHPVSPAISNPENNYPELINNIPASDQHGNYTLFT